MKYSKYLKNFFVNIGNLIISLFKTDRIYWAGSTNQITNCQIDKSVRVRNNHSLDNVNIGFATYIAKNATISNTTIGKFCSIGPNLLCGWGVHPLSGISTSPIFYSTKKQASFTLSKIDKVEERKPILIGNDVFIGANVTILDGVTIGDGAVIGAGSVVSKNIPPYAIAIGCPVQIVKYRFSEEVIAKLLEMKWWDGNEDMLKKVEANFFNISVFVQ